MSDDNKKYNCIANESQKCFCFDDIWCDDCTYGVIDQPETNDEL